MIWFRIVLNQLTLFGWSYVTTFYIRESSMMLIIAKHPPPPPPTLRICEYTCKPRVCVCVFVWFIVVIYQFPIKLWAYYGNYSYKLNVKNIGFSLHNRAYSIEFHLKSWIQLKVLFYLHTCVSQYVCYFHASFANVARVSLRLSRCLCASKCVN